MVLPALDWYHPVSLSPFLSFLTLPLTALPSHYKFDGRASALSLAGQPSAISEVGKFFKVIM